jgi:hypothetical protein
VSTRSGQAVPSVKSAHGRFRPLVSDSEVASSRELARGDTFIIYGVRRVVWCKIMVPRGLDPARGAAAGEELGTFLIDHVLERHSSWLGIIFDVRDGPSVLGPISLRVMERIFERAELVRRRVAILSGIAPSLEEQFLVLVRARPQCAKLTHDRSVALDWMTSDG